MDEGGRLVTRKIHDTDYLFLTTRVRALEGCLLNRGQMEQMLEAGSPEEAAGIHQQPVLLNPHCFAL